MDATGALIDHIDYDAFGRLIGETNPAAGDRYKFTGREWDPELGLHYYRARYYDPSIGRFISEDLISFAGGDANLYRYVANSPLTRVDPSGLLSAASYAKLVNWGARLGNAAAGFGIGYVCGYLEGLYRGDPDPHDQALQSAAFGTALGAALGATPAKFQLFVGVAGAVVAAATSDDFVVLGIRTTCIAVQIGVAKGIDRAARALRNRFPTPVAPIEAGPGPDDIIPFPEPRPEPQLDPDWVDVRIPEMFPEPEPPLRIFPPPEPEPLPELGPDLVDDLIPEMFPEPKPPLRIFPPPDIFLE